LPLVALTVDIWPHNFTLASASFLVREDNTMARKKISTTIYITPEQDAKLKLLNERTKVPVAVYIREGIDLVLDRYAEELPGQLTLDSATKKRQSG
jgi:predicted DNA-binding protein